MTASKGDLIDITAEDNSDAQQQTKDQSTSNSNNNNNDIDLFTDDSTSSSDRKRKIDQAASSSHDTKTDDLKHRRLASINSPSSYHSPRRSPQLATPNERYDLSNDTVRDVDPYTSSSKQTRSITHGSRHTSSKAFAMKPVPVAKLLLVPSNKEEEVSRNLRQQHSSPQKSLSPPKSASTVAKTTPTKIKTTQTKDTNQTLTTRDLRSTRRNTFAEVKDKYRTRSDGPSEEPIPSMSSFREAFSPPPTIRQQRTRTRLKQQQVLQQTKQQPIEIYSQDTSPDQEDELLSDKKMFAGPAKDAATTPTTSSTSDQKIIEIDDNDEGEQQEANTEMETGQKGIEDTVKRSSTKSSTTNGVTLSAADRVISLSSSPTPSQRSTDDVAIQDIKKLPSPVPMEEGAGDDQQSKTYTAVNVPDLPLTRVIIAKCQSDQIRPLKFVNDEMQIYGTFYEGEDDDTDRKDFIKIRIPVRIIKTIKVHTSASPLILFLELDGKILDAKPPIDESAHFVTLFARSKADFTSFLTALYLRYPDLESQSFEMMTSTTDYYTKPQPTTPGPPAKSTTSHKPPQRTGRSKSAAASAAAVSAPSKAPIPATKAKETTTTTRDATSKQEKQDTKKTETAPVVEEIGATQSQEEAESLTNPCRSSRLQASAAASSSSTAAEDDDTVILTYNKVTITKADINRLEPGEFLNDNIIDFYISFVLEQLDEKTQSRFHVFNTHFWPLFKRAPERCAERFNGEVKIFEKDFVIVPINEHNHWTVCIICYPGKLDDPALQRRALLKAKDTSSNDDQQAVSTQPAIMYFDSLGGTDNTAMRKLRNYLKLRYKFERKREIEVTPAIMKGHVAKVPAQTNFCDCGVFLLHYIEMFLEKPPAAIPFHNKAWFEVADIPIKRNRIRDLIYALADERQPTTTTTTTSTKDDNADEVEERKDNNNNNNVEREKTAPAASSTSHVEDAAEQAEIPSTKRRSEEEQDGAEEEEEEEQKKIGEEATVSNDHNNKDSGNDDIESEDLLKSQTPTPTSTPPPPPSKEAEKGGGGGGGTQQQDDNDDDDDVVMIEAAAVSNVTDNNNNDHEHDDDLVTSPVMRPATVTQQRQESVFIMSPRTPPRRNHSADDDNNNDDNNHNNNNNNDTSITTTMGTPASQGSEFLFSPGGNQRINRDLMDEDEFKFNVLEDTDDNSLNLSVESIIGGSSSSSSSTITLSMTPPPPPQQQQQQQQQQPSPKAKSKTKPTSPRATTSPRRSSRRRSNNTNNNNNNNKPAAMHR